MILHRKFTGARLQPILDNCQRIKEAGIWLEVTTLLIPGINDEIEQIEGIATFIADKLGCDTPWHISRYFPQPQFHQIPATPPERISYAIEIGRKAGLRYVYGGNLITSIVTACPNCGESLIRRAGYGNMIVRLNKDACPKCGFRIAGVW